MSEDVKTPSGKTSKGFLRIFVKMTIPVRSTVSRNNKRPASLSRSGAFLIKIPAATYSPTQLPMQYHRP
jgi:hypothetical protein